MPCVSARLVATAQAPARAARSPRSSRQLWLKGRRRAVWISKSDKLIEDAETRLDRNRPATAPRHRAAVTLPPRCIDRARRRNRLHDLRDPAHAGQRRQTEPHSADHRLAWTQFRRCCCSDGRPYAMANAAGDKGERGEKKPSLQGQAGSRLQHALHDARILDVSASSRSPTARTLPMPRGSACGAPATSVRDARRFLSLPWKRAVSPPWKCWRRSQGARPLRRALLVVRGHRRRNRRAQAHGRADPHLRRLCRRLPDHPPQPGRSAESRQHHRHATATLCNAKAAARGVRSEQEQCFFNHLLTAMKCPTLIAAIARDLDQGHAIVLQVVSTMKPCSTAAWPKSDFGTSARSVDRHHAASTYSTIRPLFNPAVRALQRRQTRKPSRAPPMTPTVNPATSCEAVERRDRLIEQIASLPPVQGALDQILHRFGTDLVAEVTGRSRRIVRRHDRFVSRTCLASANSLKIRRLDLRRAHPGVPRRRRDLGRSHHALIWPARTSASGSTTCSNPAGAPMPRSRAGCSTRTNQKQPPAFRPVATDVKGEKRFLSTIARRSTL